MSYLETLAQVDDLRATIAAQSPLPAETLKKLNYKFRLEWNYTSNSMEGNSLTRSETRSVMIGNITVNGKPIKDVLEVKGHDEVISTILKMGSGNVPLSETRIRDIHRGIMHEDNPERAAFIGKWKSSDNYLKDYKGERIDFTPHTEVADAMHKLTDWLAAEREKIAREDATALHPARLAFEFHLKYVSIHPFYDGNGRTARIFTNIILIAYGYPPVWVTDGPERTEYSQYLADVQGYGGSPDVFYGLMAGLLLRSQQFVLDAVEGRNIDEPGDIDKEIALLKIQQVVEEPKVKRSTAIVKSKLFEVFYPLLIKLDTQLPKFNGLFEGGSWSYFREELQLESGNVILPIDADLREMLEYYDKQIASTKIASTRREQFKALYVFSNYKDKNRFSLEMTLQIEFWEEDFGLDLFLGIPFESNSISRGFRTMMRNISRDVNKPDFLSEGAKEIHLLRSNYTTPFYKSTIGEWADKITKELLETIKIKAKAN